MTTNSERAERADRIIVALEAEIKLMKKNKTKLKIKGGQACAWRSVKDGLPEDEAWVLIKLGPEYRTICAMYTNEAGWDHEYAMDEGIPQPTHWMLIPPLPEGGDE